MHCYDKPKKSEKKLNICFGDGDNDDNFSHIFISVSTKHPPIAIKILN